MWEPRLSNFSSALHPRPPTPIATVFHSLRNEEEGRLARCIIPKKRNAFHKRMRAPYRGNYLQRAATRRA